VLVADDDPPTCKQVKALLEKAGYVVDVVHDGDEAVRRVAAFEPDVVLLDVVMPTTSGLEACRVIKANVQAQEGRMLPVLLLVPKTDATSRARGLAVGADDWLQKPIDADALLGRVAALVRMKRVFEEMRAARQLLEQMSVRDELTGMMSYRCLSQMLREGVERAARAKEPLTVALFDIDGLEAINQHFGRAAGDAALRLLADVISARARANEVVFRYGPDEALILFPRTSLLDGLQLADAVLRSFAERARPGQKFRFSATASAGVASFPGRDVRDPEELLRSTDHALATAKRAGGARACAFRQHGMLLFGPDPVS